MSALLAVIIPAFNEAKVIGNVIETVRREVSNASVANVVVVVDDGSADDTAKVARHAGATVLRHPVNLGQGAALHTGMRFALDRGAAYIASFDADGQHDPGSISVFLDALLSSDVDVILASRFIAVGQTIPAFRKLTLQLALLFTRLHTGLALTDTHNGLRLMNRRAALAMLPDQPGMAHASEMLDRLAKAKLRWIELPSVVRYDEYSLRKGQSSFNSIKILFEIFYRAMTRP